MKSSNEISESIKAATELRTIIKELFDAPRGDRIVLTPGILVGLQILLANLKVKRVAVSLYEYYDQYHLPSLEVRAFDLEGFVEQVKLFRPRLGRLSFAPKCDEVIGVGDDKVLFPGLLQLQAADILAYEVYKHMNNLYMSESRRPEMDVPPGGTFFTMPTHTRDRLLD